MELEGFSDDPPEPGAVDQFEGQLLAWKKLEGLTANIFHNFFSLGFSVAPPADLHQGQIDQKPQVPETPILFAHRFLMLIRTFPVSHGLS
jgi:hypothetical protein